MTMTPQERDLIAQFFDRVGGASQGGFNRGSVPQTQPLAPIDPDANALIVQQFQQHPEAQYRVTQTAIVQEAALAEAQNRIRQLQWQLEQTQHAMQQAAQQAPAQSRGFFSSLFGGGGQRYQPTTPPPQPQYPPNYQPGMFQQAGRGGSGFLGSALTTAAGVAGGMVAGNALMDLFGGHQGMGGGFGQGAGDGGGFLGGAFGGGGGGADPFNQAGVDTSGTDPFGGGGGGGFDQGGGDPFGGGGGGGDPFGSGGGGDPFGGGGGGFDDSST
jgi:hypothetical protein